MVRSGQGAFAPMIPYLRERQFLEFDGAPEIDREGYFIIKPPSPEWAAWIEQTRGMYGEKGVEAARKTGFFLRRTRWPEGYPFAESWRNDRGETDQRSRTSRDATAAFSVRFGKITRRPFQPMVDDDARRFEAGSKATRVIRHGAL